MPPERPIRLRVIFAIATLFALSAALVSYSFTAITGRSLWTLKADASAVASYVLLMNLIVWNGWALLAPPILWLARRARIDRHTWRTALVVHVAGALVFSTLHVLLIGSGRFGLQSLWGLEVAWFPVVQEAFFRMFDWEISCYAAIVGLSHALDFYGEARDRELRTALLETRLVEAQLTALQRQLHPHFLFNTLNAISALVHRNPDAADRMIESLSDLLRMSLRKADLQEVPLSTELDCLAAYLDIEQVHFGSRLHVRQQIDPATLGALVPTLILQPLVENAIRHGIAPRRGPGRIEIESRRAEGRLVLSVRDSGPGLAVTAEPSPHEGVGLANTRARLTHLYGADHQVTLGRADGWGCVVTVTIPFRVQAEARPAEVLGAALLPAARGARAR